MRQQGETEPVVKSRCSLVLKCRAARTKTPPNAEKYEKRAESPGRSHRRLVARLACKDDSPSISQLIDDFLHRYAADCDERQDFFAGAGTARAGDLDYGMKSRRDFFASFGFLYSADDHTAVEDLIDESYQCIVAEDCTGEVVGFAALGHSPKILEVEASDEEEALSLYLFKWPARLSRMYCSHRGVDTTTTFQHSALATSASVTPPTAEAGFNELVLPTPHQLKANTEASEESVNTSNTLWLNFLVCHKADTATLRCIIEATFASAFELQHILMFNRTALTVSSSSPLFERLEPLIDSPLEREYTTPRGERMLPSMYHCRRTAWERPLEVRVAEVEDYDDVVKIFDQQTELRSEDYGEFFLAELIGGQDEGNKCLIAEADGAAVGLAGFTTDVDINLLYNCFHVERHNFFVKPEYLERIQTTRKLLTHRRQLSSTLVDFSGGEHQGTVSPVAVGDYLQEIFSNIPGGFDRLLASVALNEEGLMPVSGMIHALKKGVQVLPSAPQLVDLKETVLLIIWQVHFTLANIRSSVALPSALVASALQMFTGIDCMQRQQLATFLLEKWDSLLTVFSTPAQTGAVPQRDHVLTQRHTRVSTTVAAHLPSVSYGGRRRTMWSSIDKRRSARLDSFFLEGDRDEADATVKVCHLCETLRTRPEFQLKTSEVSALLLCLHWWADVPITHPTMEISSEKLKNALQRLSRAAIEYFAMTYDTPGWLRKLPIEQKNAFAINIFALDEQRHAQALKMLLPAFSLFEDKEYCLLLQPPTAPLLPFMKYFCTEEKKLGGLLDQVLFVLHRQSLLTTPLFRLLRSSEIEVVAAKARGAGVRLSSSAVAQARMDREVSRSQSRADFYGVDPSESSINTGEDTQSETTDSVCGTSRPSSVDCSEDRRNRLSPTRFAVIGHACGQIVAVAEVQLTTEQQLREMMLRSNLEPYLLQEQLRTQRRVRDILDQRRRQREVRRKLRRLVITPPEEVDADEQLDAKLRFDAYGGHAVLHFCLIDPVFQYFEHTLLREIMRLARARLLHVLVEHPKSPPVAFRIFSPVKPKRILDAKYVGGLSDESAYSAARDRSSPPAPAAIQNPAVQQLLSRKHQALSHLVCKPQFLSSYSFVFHERVVVVGFSSTAYAFLKTLLFANRSYLFKDITVLAPGGLPEPRSYQQFLLSHTSVDLDEAAEMRRLFLQLRVRIIDRRLCGIDRKRKLVYLDAGPPPPYEQNWDLHNGAPKGNTAEDMWQGENVSEDAPTIPYDFLFLITGLQDASLQEIGVRSWGLTDPFHNGDTKAGPLAGNGLGGSRRGCVERISQSLARVNGCISSADPRLYDLLDENGPYLIPLRWNPLTLVVVYGRSLDAYCLIHGLLQRRVPPQKITLVLPPRFSPADHGSLPNDTELVSVSEFHEKEPMELKCNEVLKSIGVTLLEGYWLRGVLKDKKSVLRFALLSDSNTDVTFPQASTTQPAPAVVFKDDEGPPQARRSFTEQLVDDWSLDTGPSSSAIKLKPYTPAPTFSSSFSSIVSGDSQVERLQSLPCRVLLTADKRKNADYDVFQAIHDCGLVYDGRLIVNRDFQTNDPDIYGAGPLCEFSRQYRPTRETLLSQHNYNGDEVGVYLGASFLKRLSCSFLCPVRREDSRGAILDPKLLRPQREGGNPFAAAADILPMPSVQDIRSYLDGAESAAANRVDLLPRFSFPLCVQGVLPGGLHFHRLALCAGCLSRFTWWAPECVDAKSYDCLPSAGGQLFAPDTSSSEGKSDRGAVDSKVVSKATRPGEEALYTDTLQFRWSDPVASNTGNNKSWRHLIATDGQMCEIGVDKLRRLTLFKYVGPVCLRLDAFFHLMGLPISFLNMIEKKSRGKVLTDILAFLSEEEWWFEALLHPRMPTFLEKQRQWLLQSDLLRHHVQEAMEHLQRQDLLEGAKTDTDGRANEETRFTENVRFPGGVAFSAQKQAKQLRVTECFVDKFYASINNTVKNHVQAELIDLLEKYESELPFFYLPGAVGKKV